MKRSIYLLVGGAASVFMTILYTGNIPGLIIGILAILTGIIILKCGKTKLNSGSLPPMHSSTKLHNNRNRNKDYNDPKQQINRIHKPPPQK